MLIPSCTDTRTHLEHKIRETDKITQWVKAFAVNADSLSSIPRNSMVNGDNQTHTVALECPHTYTETNKQGKEKNFPK